jgi:peptide-methionine (S)-S-oxide reductase
VRAAVAPELIYAGKQPRHPPEKESNVSEQATFAAGCFWGVEAEFRRIEGVTATTVGYTGGTAPDPSYKQVCTGRTGHAEAVQVEFDPSQVSYDELLDAFWRMHNPTQLNRQGPDFGTQYRSVIFFHTPEQEVAAKNSREKAQENHRRQIVTEITEASEFYPAEDYHQRYLEKKGLAICTVTLQATS